MEKLRVNDTPVRTARNFLINNIEIELEMPEKIAEFRKYAFYAFPMAIINRAISDSDFILDSQQKAIPMVLVIEEPENVIR